MPSWKVFLYLPMVRSYFFKNSQFSVHTPQWVQPVTDSFITSHLHFSDPFFPVLQGLFSLTGHLLLLLPPLI